MGAFEVVLLMAGVVAVIIVTRRLSQPKNVEDSPPANNLADRLGDHLDGDDTPEKPALFKPRGKQFENQTESLSVPSYDRFETEPEDLTAEQAEEWSARLNEPVGYNDDMYRAALALSKVTGLSPIIETKHDAARSIRDAVDELINRQIRVPVEFLMEWELGVEDAKDFMSMAESIDLYDSKVRSGGVSAETEVSNPDRGWVYIIGCDGHEHLKIGKSRHGVNSRIPAWQTGSPYKFVKMCEIEVSNMHRLETFAHQHLKAHKLKGEWFEVDLHTAIQALQAGMHQLGIEQLDARIDNPDALEVIT